METIILMGPIGVGKSTQADLLSHELGQPRYCYDDVKETYWTEIGLNKKTAQTIEQEEGLYAMVTYMNEFKSRIISSIINDHPGHVIDLGGGAQCFNETEQVARTQDAFTPISRPCDKYQLITGVKRKLSHQCIFNHAPYKRVICEKNGLYFR